MSPSSRPSKPCALLWDDSFLWGLMAFNAMKSAELPFDLIRSGDIESGILHEYSMLFVPGGWASNKLKSLGDEGPREIRRFVEEGGNYLGFCGGAGLATLDGIGLLNIKRVPTRNRVPSFSGPVRLDLVNHAIWDGIFEPVFHAWWPSQFSIEDANINVLATYRQALPGSSSSDLNTVDVMNQGGNWESLEKLYGINLDPARLYGRPAVVEGRFGKGKVILSLIHFDTPEDSNGTIVLKHLWKYLAGAEEREQDNSFASGLPDFRASDLLNVVEELISFGERNSLWSWRNSMLLQWKRGIRGLEYCTLYGMIKALNDHVDCIPENDSALGELLPEIFQSLSTFKGKAERLLALERDALDNGYRITYEKSDNPEIIRLRTELFANSKSYGGEFKEMLDKIDGLVFKLLNSQ